MTNRFLLTPMSLDQPTPELRRLRREGWSINEPDPVRDAAVQRRIAAVNEPIARFTEEAARAGDRPVCLTGDCCAAIGALTGLQRAGVEPTLLWLDAHGDFNTPATTPSGYLGGMPLAMLTGRGDLEILDALRAHTIDDDAVVLYDARDLDPLEREALAASRVTHVTSIDALDSFDFCRGPVHVHLDPDVLNPLDAPAMAYPAPGGPDSRGAVEGIVATRRTWCGHHVGHVDDMGGRSRRVGWNGSSGVAAAGVAARRAYSIAVPTWPHRVIHEQVPLTCQHAS